MSIIAAFLWNKSPRTSISTMIFNDENLQILSPPKIQYLPKDNFYFQESSKKLIKEFFTKIEKLQNLYKKEIVIEFRIVFESYRISHLPPAKESKFVYTVFIDLLTKSKKKLKALKIKPQLRRRLSGKSLRIFKKKLRSLYVVSRKRGTGFEYHLWSVALHATPATYAAKLQRLRAKLKNAMWNETLSCILSTSIH